MTKRWAGRCVDFAKRDALRQERSRSLLARIRQAVEGAQAGALPSSKLGQAIHYTLGMWAKLELSNNVAKNSMRPVALGRNNWVHLGSEEAGPRVAAILSVVESCRRLKISVRDYLAAVLPGLADVSIQKIPHLTPAA